MALASLPLGMGRSSSCQRPGPQLSTRLPLHDSHELAELPWDRLAAASARSRMNLSPCQRAFVNRAQAGGTPGPTGCLLAGAGANASRVVARSRHIAPQGKEGHDG